METKNILILKHGDVKIKEMLCMGSTGTQYLLSELDDVVGKDSEAVLWCGDIGTTRFVPIKKKHELVKINESTWSLDIEPIEKGDL